ncbi:MAG: nucleotidyltransferase family protein [Thermoleophilia bacterium]
MIAILEDKHEAVVALCRRHGVARLYVFGSALRDDFRPGESDVDFLVEFGPMDGHSKAHAYFDLLDELRELLGTEVDLVMAGAVKNRYIARDIERSKQMLYAA